MASALCRHLEETGWDVFPEAQFIGGGPRADLAALRNGALWLIEVKRTFGLRLLEQAVEWTRPHGPERALPHLVSVAVPQEGCALSTLKRDLLERYRIGLLTVSRDGRALERIAPRIQPGSRSAAHRLVAQLDPAMRCARAGAPVHAGGHSTPYRRTLALCRDILRNGEAMSVSRLVTQLRGRHHYATDASARSALLGAMRREPGFAVDEGPRALIRLVSEGRPGEAEESMRGVIHRSCG